MNKKAQTEIKLWKSIKSKLNEPERYLVARTMRDAMQSDFMFIEEIDALEGSINKMFPHLDEKRIEMEKKLENGRV